MFIFAAVSFGTLNSEISPAIVNCLSPKNIDDNDDDDDDDDDGDDESE